ncbi:hypothetical protein B5S27_g4498 [[Candida] boidinii]|nr:hypothetical protein B5S27_g4498 [[Candida] boidinii]
MSYPTEKTKGKFFFVFWSIFNIGAVIGSCIPLARTINNDGNSVDDGTYVAFLVLTLLGSVVACFLLPVGKVIRPDGSRVVHQKNPNLKDELFELFRVMKREPWILLLFPMFFSSNWFYTYEQSVFNTTSFNIRTRSLNSLLFWFMQMIGSFVVGFMLDLPFLKRKTRGLLGWGFVFCVTFIIWGCGYLFEKDRYRGKVIDNPIDFKDSAYIGPMFLYMFYGFFDAVWQCYAYWIMGALTNSSRKAAVYAGYYKGLQSAGAAIAWRLDSVGVSYAAIFGSSWGLLAGSLIIAFPVLYYKIEETTALEKDLEETDETIADVLGTGVSIHPSNSVVSRV